MQHWDVRLSIHTYFELERFGNDCSVKVIGKNQVKKVINFCKPSFASGYHMLCLCEVIYMKKWVFGNIISRMVN